MKILVLVFVIIILLLFKKCIKNSMYITQIWLHMCIHAFYLTALQDMSNKVKSYHWNYSIKTIEGYGIT